MRTVVACDGCGRRNAVRPAPRGRPVCNGCRAPLPWIVDATAESFEAETEAAVPTLVDFWAPWCGPCRTVGPALESLAHRFAGRVKLVRTNVDEVPAPAARFHVQGIPTLVLLREGREAARHVGAVPERELERWLTQQLESTAPAPGG